MTIQVLVAAMNAEKTLPEKMNLRTDAIIGNQCDRNSVEETEYDGHTVRWLNFAERGVGLNRNNALMRATADVCLFADDDMIYADDYAEKVEAAFSRHPDADVLVFNLIEEVPTRYVNRRDRRVGRLNYMRYGTARIAIRLSSVRDAGIAFHLCFGGGTPHAHGEDNLFLTDCLNKKLKVYAVPEFIATLTEERESTWNAGYDEKYLADQGRLFRTISRRWWRLLCLQDAFRHRRTYGGSWRRAYRLMKAGARAVR